MKKGSKRECAIQTISLESQYIHNINIQYYTYLYIAFNYFTGLIIQIVI